MKRVTILSVNSRIPNFSLYPIRYNKHRLKKLGYEIKCVSSSNPKHLSCDILCLNSKYFTKWWEDPDRVFSFIQKAKRYCNKIIWMDDSDSSGVTHFELLPEIDLYLKKQLLKDKKLYTVKFYGDRIFTDYYNRNFTIVDERIYESQPLDLNLAYKVKLSWHIGLGDMIGDLVSFPKILGPVKARLPAKYEVTFISPKNKRNLDIMARGKRYYERNTVRFHRKKMDTVLEKMGHLKTALRGRVSVRRYKSEMSKSKIVVSPFGWGEIGVRDFEAYIYGAILIKPDMSHLETWPNLFIPGETFVPVKWDFTDLEEVIKNLLSDSQRRLNLAINGQDAYKRVISEEGMKAFCHRFVKLIET